MCTPSIILCNVTDMFEKLLNLCNPCKQKFLYFIFLIKTNLNRRMRNVEEFIIVPCVVVLAVATAVAAAAIAVVFKITKAELIKYLYTFVSLKLSTQALD